MYSIPLIQPDLRQEETIHQIAEALDCLDRVVKDIFSRIERRILENKAKLEEIQQRACVAKMKVEKLTGSNKATKVFSSAKYPASDLRRDYKSIFSTQEPFPCTRTPVKIKSKHMPLEGRVVKEKLQFYHVKVSNKLLHKNVEITPEEGLGSLPKDIDSIGSLLLFNTSENPYRKYVMLDPLGVVTKTRLALEEEEERKMEAAPISISQRDVMHHPAGENYFYSPGLGEVPLIDVPLDLPDLPGVADDLRYSMDSGPMIAPSVSTTPAIPELPSLVPESPTSPTANTAPPPPAPPPPTFLPPPPPPPPPPGPPPPPPPPPPPQKTAPSTAVDKPVLSTIQPPKEKSLHEVTGGLPEDVGSAHASLMEAIRQAGGTDKAKLRSAKDMKIEAKKKKQEQKAAVSGGDLMADLHSKLSLRRKGISGAKSDISVGGAMDRVSAMIPPPTRQDHHSSNTEDDEDWD